MWAAPQFMVPPTLKGGAEGGRVSEGREMQGAFHNSVFLTESQGSRLTTTTTAKHLQQK